MKYINYFRTKIPCDQHQSIRDTKLFEQIDRKFETVTILPEFQKWAITTLNRQNDREIADRSHIYDTQTKAIQAKQHDLIPLQR